MNRVVRAELLKLWRPRTITFATVLTVVYAVVATTLVLHAVGSVPGPDSALTKSSLAQAGGGTAVFTAAMSFAGFFLLVAFTGATAAEFSRGTVRTMALRQPDRLALLGGRLVALLGSAAVLLAGAEVIAWGTARVLAPGQGIDTAAWISPQALGAGLGDYAKVLYWAAGYALLGTALAVVVRSVPVALAIGIGWAGPVEHIIGNSWSAANGVFPGLLLEDFAGGGREGMTVTAALVRSALWGVAAGILALVAFTRRDVA